MDASLEKSIGEEIPIGTDPLHFGSAAIGFHPAGGDSSTEPIVSRQHVQPCG
jgi:hypothetical protein